MKVERLESIEERRKKFRTRIRHTRRRRRRRRRGSQKRNEEDADADDSGDDDEKSETPVCCLVPVTVQQSKKKGEKTSNTVYWRKGERKDAKKRKKTKRSVGDELYSLYLLCEMTRESQRIRMPVFRHTFLFMLEHRFISRKWLVVYVCTVEAENRRNHDDGVDWAVTIWTMLHFTLLD